uniref:Acetyl-coenzyme A transporter 1 n=1 Tax=Diabrotica virgifera virgifera TaxID=50390 RepID=A0A6P7G5N7_DIAVI
MNVMERRKNKNKSSIPSQMENGDLPSSSTCSNIRGDERNILLLFFLYTLQGIPLGLSSAIPMILQNRGVSYKQQAEFSFVTWPFSLKLLWAPIVDSIFSSRIGRRKTWMIPSQYLIGGFMLLLSSHVNKWLGEDGSAPNIEVLTFMFFSLNFLAATQDIAVDGWALTMLRKENVGHASTCNSVGQTTGFFLSYVLFMALESATFCNQYLRTIPETEGKSLTNLLITKVIYLYCKYWIWIFVRGIGFSSTDSVMGLKLVEAGIPKERLGLMALPLIPLQLAMPLVIAKYTTGPKPLNIFLKAIPYRLAFGFVAAFVVFITPILVPDASNGLPFYYVILLFACYALHQVCVYCMFVAQMAFFAKISDSAVGGTYMTLLNTLTNLGGNWPTMLALYWVDPLTWKRCEGGAESVDNICRNNVEKVLCEKVGGKCVTVLDGFYIETLICVAIGFLWYLWGAKKVRHLQQLGDNAWKLKNKKSQKS